MKAVKMRVSENCSAQDIKKYLEGLGYSWSHYLPFGATHFYGYEDGDVSYSNGAYFEAHTNEEIFIPAEAPQQIVNKGVVEDNVNNPSHYTSHPSGIECIDVTRHMSFNLGNATKYIWRCDLKKDAIEDLRKAIFYLNDEIELRLKQKENK